MRFHSRVSALGRGLALVEVGETARLGQLRFQLQLTINQASRELRTELSYHDDAVALLLFSGKTVHLDRFSTPLALDFDFSQWRK